MGKNHFQSVCQKKAAGNRKSERQSVRELDTDEQLLTLDDGPIEVHEELLAFRHGTADRWYTRLKVDLKTVRFLLDTGATCSLIPELLVRALGR